MSRSYFGLRPDDSHIRSPTPGRSKDYASSPPRGLAEPRMPQFTRGYGSSSARGDGYSDSRRDTHFNSSSSPHNSHTADRWRPPESRNRYQVDRYMPSTASPSTHSTNAQHHNHGRDHESNQLRSPRGHTRLTSHHQSESTERVLPKHFPRPLTCFYWATQGHCNKSDDECWYAHHHTGVVAAAPVRVGNEGVVAGRVADDLITSYAFREEALKSREDDLIAREQDVKRNEETVTKSAENLKVSIQNMFSLLAKVQEEANQSMRELGERRGELIAMNEASFDPRSPSYPYSDFGNKMLLCLNSSAETILCLKSNVKDVLDHMSNKVGTCEFPPLENRNSETDKCETSEP